MQVLFDDVKMGRFWGKMAFGARFGAFKCLYLAAFVQKLRAL